MARPRRRGGRKVLNRPALAMYNLSSSRGTSECRQRNGRRYRRMDGANGRRWNRSRWHQRHRSLSLPRLTRAVRRGSSLRGGVTSCGCEMERLVGTMFFGLTDVHKTVRRNDYIRNQLIVARLHERRRRGPPTASRNGTARRGAALGSGRRRRFALAISTTTRCRRKLL